MSLLFLGERVYWYLHTRESDMTDNEWLHAMELLSEYGAVDCELNAFGELIAIVLDSLGNAYQIQTAIVFDQDD